ncbi:acyl-CoA dehydrogenase family protein [Streptomyces sp. NPDC020792]|uniref:acyl-CoA dehydrogenase family protein n=1 Tax=Streptomyces sp. NPDC020792 TaxID=3365089 RepID=UPI00379B1D1A
MDLVLSADQKLLHSTVKSFLEKEAPLTKVREMADAQVGFERDWWGRAAELGCAAMLVPEELGGGSVSGKGLLDLVIVAEEFGRGVAPGPLPATNIVLAGLVESVEGPDHSVAVQALAAGESVATWAVYEPGRQWHPLAPALTAEASGDGFVLDGVKDRVELAEQADLLLVTAMAPGGLTQFLVPTDSPGVTVVPTRSLDLVRRLAEVRFSRVEVPATAVVGAVGGAGPAVERQLQVAVVLQCAETCGAVDRAFEFTVQWAFDRFSFGRPLASYQALKHRFADMKTWLEACHATTSAAAHAVQDRADDAAELVSVAKSYVGSRSTDILQDCVQMHGGIGVTWEHDLHLYLRRATVNRALYGTPEDHRLRIADIVAL